METTDQTTNPPAAPTGTQPMPCGRSPKRQRRITHGRQAKDPIDGIIQEGNDVALDCPDHQTTRRPDDQTTMLMPRMRPSQSSTCPMARGTAFAQMHLVRF